MTHIETLKITPDHLLAIAQLANIEMDRLLKIIEPLKTPPRQPEHGDSARLDWLTNNPLEALDIFGHVKGADAVRWIRQDIDNRIKESA